MNWPILAFELTIPFLSIRTHLMNQCTVSRERQYIAVYINLYKWRFMFELYNTIDWRDRK
jgi:hypothetical protein